MTNYKRKSENPPILIYNDWSNMILNLSDEDAGFVFKSIFRHKSGIESEVAHDNPIINGIVAFMLNTIDREQEGYIHRCDANAENRRGKAPLTTVNDGQPQSTMVNDSQPPLTMVNQNKNKNNNKNNNNKEESLSNDKDKKKPSPRFVPPTLDEIAEYCAEKKYNIDAERFFNYYESKGWMVGKTKMTKWKSALANWVKTEKEKGYNHQPIQIPQPTQEEEEDEVWAIFKHGGN